MTSSYLTMHKYLLKRTVPAEGDPKKSSSFTRLISGINFPQLFLV